MGLSRITATRQQPSPVNVLRKSIIILQFILLISLIVLCIADASKNNSSKKQNIISPGNDNSKDFQESTRVISLAESINRSRKLYQDPERAKASREQWKKALEEIKELTLPIGGDKRVKENSLMQWKMLLDQPTKVVLDTETNMTTATMEPKSSSTDDDEDDSMSSSARNGRGTKTTPRFEGFPSWERMLQDWTDDVQEYMNKIDAENAGGGYPMSSWGTPSKGTVSPSNKNSTTNTKEDEHRTTKIEPKKKKKTISLPVPAAAQDGEPVLPHTDISDKSKRIWIVTTASLPWMTGTAVNPLLRAAYMTEGRNEAGGSVTLMLPWLERRQDQETVYGKDKIFESCEEQERYVRDWLRDTAKLPKASEELNIEWYTAWQSKVENSIYSMGDITALIPEEAVDICILEEPEHLNWYVLLD
jgi:hypothetical protein